MQKKIVHVGEIACGSDRLFAISGPCVIEEEAVMMRTAEALKKVSEKLDLPIIFKSSFTKDNRSALSHYEGPGLDEGLAILGRIRNEFDMPVFRMFIIPINVKLQQKFSISFRYRPIWSCRPPW
jgi:2-dehydro-3-deoxyphosphooctonate aldolase (KDO 8-P synthase)